MDILIIIALFCFMSSFTWYKLGYKTGHQTGYTKGYADKCNQIYKKKEY